MALQSRPTAAFRSAAAPAARSVAAAPRAARLVARVANVDTAAFDAEVIAASKNHTVLVDFWSSWCGPCKLVAPLMEWTEKEYAGVKVVKVEHDANPDLIAKYKVYGLPALLLFKNGAFVEGSKREGAVSKPLLIKYLETHGVTAAAK